ncbi:MAG: acyl-CoA dehydrogenase family protein [Pseudomonadota bacterium]|nr:acyl-CoA dehydrogenase family protein [Pseudomonadota bacterium]
MTRNKIACFGLSVPDSGSNIRAEKVGGVYKINGSKLYINNSPMADFTILVARTVPGFKLSAISFFIVELPIAAVVISH